MGVIAAGLALRIGLALADVSELAISVLTPCRIDTLWWERFCLSSHAARVGCRCCSGVAGRRRSVSAWPIWVLSTYSALANTGVPVLHQIRNTLYALFFGALTLLSLRPSTELISRAFRSRVLRFFGKYSYGLYVYHGLLAWYLYESAAVRRANTARIPRRISENGASVDHRPRLSRLSSSTKRSGVIDAASSRTLPTVRKGDQPAIQAPAHRDLRQRSAGSSRFNSSAQFRTTTMSGDVSVVADFIMRKRRASGDTS